MNRILTLTIVSIALLGLCSTASAKVEISGCLTLETAWSIEDGGEGNDDLFSLARFGVGESTLGFAYISDDKRFEGVAELCFYGRSDDNIVETALAYMVYNGDNFSVMLGHNDHPSDDFGPSQTLDDGTAQEGYGNSVLDTNEQIRFTYGDKYKLVFSIDNPYKENVWEDGGAYAWLPGLTGAMEMTFGNVVIHPWAHFEYLKWEGDAADDSYYSLDLGLEICGEFGLVGFTVAANFGINTAQNGPVISGDPLVIDNVVEDNVKQFGAWGELRVGALALGAGYAKASREDWADDPYTMAAYANYSIEFGMITFTPEIVWFNQGQDETGAESGSTFRFGLWTSMEF